MKRIRGFGIVMVFLVFCLLISTNVIWLKKTVAENKLKEVDHKARELQAQLAAEQGRSSALEKKLSSLPQPSSSASVAAPPAKTAAPLSESILSPKVETRGGKAPAASEPIASAKAPSAEEPAASSQPEAGGTVPVVIMACCRPSYLEKTLVTLTNRLPKDGRFKLVVSQDGTHEGVASLMKDKFPSVRFMQHVDDSPIVKKSGAWELDSYYKIARHYGWALGKVFDDPLVQWAIVLEDDLEVASDFFEYMSAGNEMLTKDKTLWTVTAWNDNGMPDLATDIQAVYRSDFFAGLGWIMTRSLWDELGPKWPVAYWDDWMREPAQRKGRACLRPEMSRTVTFGKEGSSQGQFFESHLSKMKLNADAVDFTRMDMAYLVKARYDPAFTHRVTNAKPVEVGSSWEGDGRISYKDYADFKKKAHQLGIMDDEKAGVPRTAYLGVVSVKQRGNTLFIAPEGGKEMYLNS